MKHFIFSCLVLIPFLTQAGVRSSRSESYIVNKAQCLEQKQLVESKVAAFVKEKALKSEDFSVSATWTAGHFTHSNNPVAMLCSEVCYDEPPTWTPDNCTIRVKSDNSAWGLERKYSQKISGSNRGTQCSALVKNLNDKKEVILVGKSVGGLFKRYCQVSHTKFAEKK